MVKFIPFFKKLALIGVITLAIWFVYGNFVMPIFAATRDEILVKLFFTWYLPVVAALFVFNHKHFLLKLSLAIVGAVIIVFGLIFVFQWLGAL